VFIVKTVIPAWFWPESRKTTWKPAFAGMTPAQGLREEKATMTFAGKKIIILGERDGVPAPAIAACMAAAGAEVVYSITECFV
jgi:glycine reductase